MKKKKNYVGLLYIKIYTEFWSISLEHFKVHKTLNYEECDCDRYSPDEKNWFGFSSKRLTNGKISFSRYCNNHEYTTAICNVFEWMPEIWEYQLIPERRKNKSFYTIRLYLSTFKELWDESTYIEKGIKKIYLWQVHIISFQKMCTHEKYFSKKITIHSLLLY